MDTWRYRRRFIFAGTGFSMAIIVYILHLGLEGRVAETAITMAFGIVGTLISVYVAGAVVDDKNNSSRGE